MILNYTLSSQIMKQKMGSFPGNRVQNLGVHLISLSFKPTATESTVDLNVTPHVPSLSAVYFLTVVGNFVNLTGPQCAQIFDQILFWCVCEGILDEITI